MKSLMQILFFFLLISPLSFSQWTNQNPVPDGNDLWSTFFADDSTGWIVGSGGFITKTTNAGAEWIQQNSGTNFTLTSVCFTNQNSGWICGDEGLILKTTNGGSDWFSLISGTTEHLTDIQFCNSDIGYVSGFGGTILKTTDGGLSWISLNTETTSNLYAIDFVDEFIGYAVGGDGDTISVLKTTDGGFNWIDKSSGFPQTKGYCLTVEFIDANTGFIGGSNYSGFLHKTTDGGDTWGQSLSTLLLEQTEKNGKEQLSIYPSVAGIKSIYFKNADNGWYVSWNGLDNYIYSTTNGGITWGYQRTFWEHSLISIFVSQDGTGLAVGAYGLIYLKDKNDVKWSRLLSGTNDRIHCIYFIDENVGWAGGNRYGNPYKKIILKTTNGGKQWKTQLEKNISSYSRCFYFINDLLGWHATSNNAPKELVGAGLYRTTDGGENWISVHSADFSSVFFINQDTGWVTSDYDGYSGGIYKSMDGGTTLIKKSSISTTSIYFSDQNVGWATSVEGILKSTDGGETWINKSNSTRSYVKFYDSNIGMCVGKESISVSTDGGETWYDKTGPTLQTINFINSTTVFGYTSEGTIYKTTNLGASWETLNTGLGFGETAFFINEYTGWVGGKNGIMFKYSIEPPQQPVPPVWSNQITVKDAGGTESSKVLTFGQHIDATDGLDASLGEYEIPPPPPSTVFDARFNLPTIPQVNSWTDYRDSAETDIVWNITFQPGSAGYPITFTWDSTAFPEGTFYLKNRISGSFVNVNMKNQGSYTLTNSAITSLKINFKGLSKTMFVKNDWNIISVPLLAEDMSVSNLFPSATSSAFYFQDGYINEDTLETGVGYWLKFEEDEQMQIYGLTQEDNVSVLEGWNIIGVYEKDIPVNKLTSTPPGIVATYFFEFNNGYGIIDTLKSGQGYWVRVTQDGVLNLNGGSLEKTGEERKLFTTVVQDWGKIKIIDSKDKTITLYTAEGNSDLGVYELPPLPPAGIFDARYSSGRLAENLDSKKIIKISSDNYPITIRAEGIDLTVRDIINGELLNTELKNGEELRITNNKITSIEVIGKVTNGLPVSYELYQNYPNPFNPATRIKFAIPKQSQVNLSIYNVLGELVTTLVNKHLNAGYYEFDFNAAGYSSGVYIYRIKTEDYIESKKMLLMK